jgi:uncharacterized SAM-binding protein YcdF (DUF218 family)
MGRLVDTNPAEPMSVSTSSKAERWSQRKAPLWRRLLRWVAALACGMLVALAGGFLWFVASVPSSEVTLHRNADGIVVLTGGASRIADAIDLLASGRGKRLLISGVYPATTSGEIAQQVPEYHRLMACCVDLGHYAINTVGNALETRRWAEQRGFRSLIVVTSSYHMPRTMAELARQMPEIELIPYPVVTDRLRAQPWWTSGPTARLMLSEYVKYLLSQLRIRVNSASSRARLAGSGRT